MMFRLAVLLAVLVVVVGVGQDSGAVTTSLPIQTVILSDDIAPGETRPFHRIGGPVVNNSGQIAFYGEMSSTGNNKQAGVWLGRAGQFQRIARERHPAPGLPDTSFMYVNTDSGLSIDENGEVGFQTIDEKYVDGVTEYRRRLWRGDATNLAPFMSEGDAAPGTSGVFSSPGMFTLHPNGTVAFWTGIDGDGITSENDSGVWSNASGQLELLAREGDEAPGTNGRLFRSSGTSGGLNPFSRIQMTDSGQVLFRAGLNNDDYGMWMGDSAEMAPVAIPEEAAPDVDGAIFDSFRDANISGNGRLAFDGRMTPGVGGVTVYDSYGIWAGTADGISLVARSSAAVPDMPPGVVYDTGNNTFESPDINNAGQMVFHARLGGDGIHPENDTVLLHGTPDDLHVLFQEGDPIPGLPEGVVIRDFGSCRPRINESGQIVFGTLVQGPGVFDLNDAALFAYDPAAGMMMIAREFDWLEVAPGDVRQISDVYGKADARPSTHWSRRGFTDNGQLVFYIAFRDDTQGIFTATIPEPSTLILLGMGAVGLLAYAWRKRKRAV